MFSDLSVTFLLLLSSKYILVFTIDWLIDCLFRAALAACGSSQARPLAYSTAHGNAGSLTHWARPGIEPATSWFLVGFINHWATKGTPPFLIQSKFLYTNLTKYILHLYSENYETQMEDIKKSWLNKWIIDGFIDHGCVSVKTHRNKYQKVWFYHA